LFGKDYVVFPYGLTTLKFTSAYKAKRKPLYNVLSADGRKMNISLEVSYTLQKKDIYPKLWDVYNKTDYELGFADIIENIVRDYVRENITFKDYDSRPRSKSQLKLASALEELIYKKFEALGYDGKTMFKSVDDNYVIVIKKWTISADPKKQQNENKRMMFTQVFSAGNNTTKSNETSSEWSPVFVKLANACSSKGDMPSKRSINMCVLVKSILVKKIMKHLKHVSGDWKECKPTDPPLEKSDKCDTWAAHFTELQRDSEMLRTVNKASN